MFNMLIMGPPGAGKGTQAQAIAKRLTLKHLASGDVVRAEVSGNTESGKKAKSFMDSGNLVPDDLVTSMVGSHIKTACESSSGAPRRSSAKTGGLDGSTQDGTDPGSGISSSGWH